MEKTIIGSLLILLITGGLFAEEGRNDLPLDVEKADSSVLENKIALDYAHYLFANGIMKDGNAEKIEQLSSFLTARQREDLYEDNSRSGVGPFLLNLLVGFGVGSFWQGDTAVGCIQLFGDIAGFGMMIPGIILSMKAADKLETSSVGTALTIIGGFVTVGVAVPAYIRPWTFAADKNRKMRRALRVDEYGKAIARGDVDGFGVTLAFAPIIQPVTSEYGLAARISF